MDLSQEDTHTRARVHLWTATGHERPVFLDEHGRRRRWVLAGGPLAGAAAGLWLAALIAGAIGFATLPSWRAYHRDRIWRQTDARIDRDTLTHRRLAEARSTVRPSRVPSVLHRGELPLNETS